MRIAVDAMGGDFAPAELVAGAVEAARSLPTVTRLFLVGDEAAVRSEMRKSARVPDTVEIRHASETVAMDELPAQAVRRKRDSSVVRAIEMVRDGEADAMVSAGNTGAIVVAATLKLRLLDGVERPAIAAVMPTQGRPLLLIDAGANIEAGPRLLLQFAAMGSVYSREVLGQPKPAVGLLSIGGEEIKGNETTKEAFGLLSNSPLNFRGNVEGHDLFEGETDVAVCDGFVGNIVLKTSESLAVAIGHWLKQELTRNPVRWLGTALLRGALGTMKRRMDPQLYGGAPLLGVNGTCIKTHGSSKAKGVFHAVRVAAESAGHQVNHLIEDEIRKLGIRA
jgi:glycerol-3-phosphate acyltransferase PlsX